MKHVTLITDGACLGNPGPGGWAFLLRYEGHELLKRGYEPQTTNNRMEMMAVIEGLNHLNQPCQVLIRTDSKYLVNAFKDGWIVNWKRNNWRTSNKKDVKNKDLWLLLDERLNGHKIVWEWVKGHAGDPDNEKVDQAAREIAEKGSLDSIE